MSEAKVDESLCAAVREKSMNVRIEVTTSEHAQAIARIAAEALSVTIDADSPRVQQILNEAFTYVAIVDDDVVGFIDTLMTMDASLQNCFELDLLAVSPAAQGQGIGSRLVARTLSAARKSVAASLRTLVRCDNFAMQSICARQGLKRSRHSYQLYVSDAKATAPYVNQEHRARIIPVHTLTYSGYWLGGGAEARSRLIWLRRCCGHKMAARLWEL